MKKFCLFLGISILSIGCVPEALKGFDPDTTTPHKTDMGGKKMDMDMTEKPTEPSAQFKEVADIFLAKCSNQGCHGGTVGNNLKVENAADATYQEVYDAMLTSTPAIKSGNPIVMKGDAAASDYIIRMIITPGEADFMPLGSSEKVQADIDLTSAWINAGAKF